MDTRISLTFDQIPPMFSLCFQGDCPKSDTCIRFLAGSCLPGDRVCGQAVYPTARQGNTCKMYKKARIIHAACGFTALFAEVKQKDSSTLRNRIRAYLGGKTTYYRFHHGERMLTPEQQKWIINLFHRYGYTGDLHFDAYRDIYDFTEEY